MSPRTLLLLLVSETGFSVADAEAMAVTEGEAWSLLSMKGIQMKTEAVADEYDYALQREALLAVTRRPIHGENQV